MQVWNNISILGLSTNLTFNIQLCAHLSLFTSLCLFSLMCYMS